MCGGSGGNDYAKQEARQQAQRDWDIRTGTKGVNATFGNTFNDGYYRGLRNDVVGMHEPQVQRQANDAHSQMLFNLARQGIGNSNSADRNYADLKDAKARALLGVERNADNIVNTRKAAVEKARGDVLSQLAATANVGSAMQGAQQNVDAQLFAPQYDLPANLFAGVGTGLMSYNDYTATRDKYNEYNAGNRAGGGGL